MLNRMRNYELRIRNIYAQAHACAIKKLPRVPKELVTSIEIRDMYFSLLCNKVPKKIKALIRKL